MALHEQCVGATDEWYTPAYVFNALGLSFDLDVASPGLKVTPWIPSALTERSLEQDWTGFIWMNPPFGKRNGIVPWLEKFIQHGNGICLVPDRTSAPWWQKYMLSMELILFVSPKIQFIDVSGRPGPSPAQGTCLGGIGDGARWALHRAAANDLGLLLRPVEQS